MYLRLCEIRRYLSCISAGSVLRGRSCGVLAKRTDITSSRLAFISAPGYPIQDSMAARDARPRDRGHGEQRFRRRVR